MSLTPEDRNTRNLRARIEALESQVAYLENELRKLKRSGMRTASRI